MSRRPARASVNAAATPARPPPSTTTRLPLADSVTRHSRIRASIVRRPSVSVLVPLLLAAALLLRVVLALRPGLWGDEIFSLAMATGHSLEHRAASADPARGDFVQNVGPEAASAYRRYVEHTDPPAGVGEVTRAVFISDTSPPLYYLLLNGWTRLTGTS